MDIERLPVLAAQIHGDLRGLFCESRLIVIDQDELGLAEGQLSEDLLNPKSRLEMLERPAITPKQCAAANVLRHIGDFRFAHNELRTVEGCCDRASLMGKKDDLLRNEIEAARIKNKMLRVISERLGKALREYILHLTEAEKAFVVPIAETCEVTTASAQSGESAPQIIAKCITKKQVLIAFGELVKIDLSKALGNGKGLFGEQGARTQKGTRGARHESLWDPIVLAIGLHEKHSVPIAKLQSAFSKNAFLSDWHDEWEDKVDLLGLSSRQNAAT